MKINNALKPILIAAFLYLGATTILYSQTIPDFLNSLSVLAEPSDYQNSDELINAYSSNIAYPSSVLSAWNYENVDFFVYTSNEPSVFFGSNKKCKGRYFLKTNVTTILFRTDSGYPETYYLLNVLKDGVNYNPVAELLIFSDSSDGTSIYYSITSDNKIKVYHLGEENAVLTRYSINSLGQFVLETSLEVHAGNTSAINAF